jgi:ABC-type antimicrobial peptide transport system permease subunit
VDREQPVFNTALVQDLVDGAVAKQKFEFVILAIFAGLAITLAAVGIYGVTAYAVGRRTQEIGVRMSLGARPGAVVAMILGQGMRWAIAGLACGLVGAWAVARFLESFLFGVKPTDALTFSIAAVLVVFVAGLANLVPARRATRINPVNALRCE